MGWTSYHRAKGETHAEHFQREMDPKMVILESAAKGGTFYAAVKNLDTEEIFALVILFRWAPNSYYNFTTKWMDETVGPCEDECPAKILDLLTPTDREWAVAWRERCLANLARTAEVGKKSAKVKDGSTIRLAEPLNFTGGITAQEFRAVTVGKRRYWLANPGTLAAFRCRLPRDWARRYDWELTA